METRRREIDLGAEDGLVITYVAWEEEREGARLTSAKKYPLMSSRLGNVRNFVTRYQTL